MTIKDFEYDGETLSSYGMMSCDPEEEQTFVSRVIDKGSQSPIRSSPAHYSTRYDDTLELHFLIIRDECKTTKNRDYILSDNEINKLNTWLSSPKRPLELKVMTDKGWSDIFYKGIFSDIQPFVLNHECYGLKLTFTCDSPYGYRKTTPYAYISSANRDMPYSLNITNNSCEKSYFIASIESNGETLQGDVLIEFYRRGVTWTDKELIMRIVLDERFNDRKKVVINFEDRTITDENGVFISPEDIGFEFVSNYCGLPVPTTTISWVTLFRGENKFTSNLAQTGENSGYTVRITRIEKVKIGGFND